MVGKMKFKPKEIMVNLPAIHLFDHEDGISELAGAINTIISGKVKIKCESLGRISGQFAGLFYVQRNHESKQIRDEFMQLIEQEEISNSGQYVEKQFDSLEDEPDSFPWDFNFRIDYNEDLMCDKFKLAERGRLSDKDSFEFLDIEQLNDIYYTDTITAKKMIRQAKHWLTIIGEKYID